MSANYSYEFDNGAEDTALWSGLLSDVVQAGGNYAAAALGNRGRRNELTVGPAPPSDNAQIAKWAMIGGGVLLAVLVLVMVLRKKGGG